MRTALWQAPLLGAAVVLLTACLLAVAGAFSAVAAAGTGAAAKGLAGRPGAAAAPPAGAQARSAPPTWRLKSYRKVGYDRSFKADLIDELPEPPRLVVFGGSRAMRFEPDYLFRHTGLPAFNAAVQNCRPEDVYALSSYLFARAPDVKVDCFFAVQTATFADAPLHPGLLYDWRLSQSLPPELVAAQKKALGRPPVEQLLGGNRYSQRGLLTWNAYDRRRQRPGYSLDEVLAGYIKRLLPKYAWHGPVKGERAKAYFEKTMQLYNAHGSVPVVVLMPYHPKALAAFRAAGFQKKVAELKSYLHDASTRCAFQVVDLLDIRSFGGRPGWFYDGAHVTTENSRRIIDKVLQAAPDSLR